VPSDTRMRQRSASYLQESFRTGRLKGGHCLSRPEPDLLPGLTFYFGALANGFGLRILMLILHAFFQ
jgi:hypothetical protein